MDPAVRSARDSDAKQALLDLEFYSEGRGLMMVPDLIDVYDKLNETRSGRRLMNDILKYRWGFVIERDAPVGLFPKPAQGFNLAVLGCATCHSGRAAGMFVPGLGNKNIDVRRIGEDVHRIEKLYALLHLKPHASPEYEKAKKFALKFAETIDVKRISNLTQGLVPVSIIQTWFYTQHGDPLPEDMRRGATKVPALWGYGTKQATGKYCDGFGDLPAWLVSIELTAGQEPETVRRYMPKVEYAETIFADLLPPEYPFEKHCESPMPGKKVFDDNCAGCHGTYERDSGGNPIYKEPKFVPIKTVQTDSDRTDAITPQFEELVDSNPLVDVMRRNDLGRGYIAPRLEGVWARFPYLHNASVPSLGELLTPPEERRKFFSLNDAGEERRYDRINAGITVPMKGSVEYATLEIAAKIGSRDTYYTERKGQSNLGHPFGTKLSGADKAELIAYLKCL
jgi:mono/diheme cytochrome c family protein